MYNISSYICFPSTAVTFGGSTELKKFTNVPKTTEPFRDRMKQLNLANMAKYTVFKLNSDILF